MLPTLENIQENAHAPIDKLIKTGYAHGFVTPIESDTFPPGLSEDIIRKISAKKNEPDWVLNWRLKAYHRWLSMEDPEWAHVNHPYIDFQSMSYYSAPRKKDSLNSLDEVDPQLLEAYNKLGDESCVCSSFWPA